MLTSILSFVRPDLTREQAWEVLEYAKDIYNPEAGLTNRDLDGYALHPFGPRPRFPEALRGILNCITFGPEIFSYQCFLSDNRCALIRRSLSDYSVIQSEFNVEDDTPNIFPFDRVPRRVYEILESVIADSPDT